MRNILLSFCLAVLASTAHATTIDFEEFAASESGYDTITSQGFTLVTSRFLPPPGNTSYSIERYAGNSVYILSGPSTLFLEDSTGDVFSLSSATLFPASAYYPEYGLFVNPLTIKGYRAGGGSVLQTTIAESGEVTFGSEWTNLLQVQFINPDSGPLAGGLAARIDNIVVTSVPIPPALLLFGSALAGLIGLRRRAQINPAT